jgi:hypothetical protein
MNYGIIGLLEKFAVFIHADAVSAQGLELKKTDWRPAGSPLDHSLI